MKNFFRGLMLAALFLIPMLAFAAGELDPPSWLGTIIDSISGVKFIGPAILFIIKWAGLVAGVMTVLSIFVQGLLGIPEVIARFSGAPVLADKIKSISDKVLPWVKYLSNFNVQKKL